MWFPPALRQPDVDDDMYAIKQCPHVREPPTTTEELRSDGCKRNGEKKTVVRFRMLHKPAAHRIHGSLRPPMHISVKPGFSPALPPARPC